MTSIGVAQMPTDRSTTDSSAGVNSAGGTNNECHQPHTQCAETKILARRRLKESDVNVVNQPMLKKALGGTIVGNTMEWYDVGVFGYLITTMGPVFLPEADKSVQTLFLLGTFAATFIARPLGGVIFGWLGDKIGPPEGPRRDTDADGCEHVRRRPAARLRADRHVGRCPAGPAQARPGLLHRRRVRRCHHLRERIRPGQAPRLLRQLPGHGQLPRLRPRRRPGLRACS